MDYSKASPGLVWSRESRRRHGVLQTKSVSLPAVNEALEDSRRTCLLCLMMLSSAGHDVAPDTSATLLSRVLKVLPMA